MSDFNPTPERQKQIPSLLAPLESVNTFVTDSHSDKKFIQALKTQGIKVVVA
jgi:DeoR/GlpR family transcriptional regulator of sugar metabolism